MSNSLIFGLSNELVNEGDKLQYKFSLEAVEEIVKKSIERKKDLWNLFNQYWNFDGRGNIIDIINMPVSDDEEYKEVVPLQVIHDLDDMSRKKEQCFLNIDIIDRKNAVQAQKIIELFSYGLSETTNEVSGIYNELLSKIKFINAPSKKLSKKLKEDGTIEFPQVKIGEKMSRLLLKTCFYFGIKVDEMPYQRNYLRYCNALSNKIKQYKIILSLNPTRFFHLSYGKDWSSCLSTDVKRIHGYKHDLDNSYYGVYNVGCFGYLLDQYSFVVSLIDKDYQDLYPEKEPQIYRMVCQYKLGHLICGRLYPDGVGKEYIYNFIRKRVENIFADLEGVQSEWTEPEKTCSVVNRLFTTGTIGYNDVGHSSIPVYTRLKTVKWPSFENSQCYPFKISTDEVICPSCGKVHDSMHSILCDNCAEKFYQ